MSKTTKTDDEKKAYHRAYYQANKEHIKATTRRRYVEKREEVLAYEKGYNKKNAEKIAARNSAKWRQDLEGNRAKSRARRPAYYAKNRDAILARNRLQHHNNRDKRLQQKREWVAANPHRGAAYSGKRRAMLLRATPSWAEPFFIEGAYEIAALRSKVTGVPWEVDHMVPLISDLVCGLHVEHNLRVVPLAINRSKGNLFWPDMP